MKETSTLRFSLIIIVNIATFYHRTSNVLRLLKQQIKDIKDTNQTVECLILHDNKSNIAEIVSGESTKMVTILNKKFPGWTEGTFTDIVR